MGGEHGMGHAVRCLALAHALNAQGAHVLFLTSTEGLENFVFPFTCLMIRNTHGLDNELLQLLATDVLIVDTKYPYTNDDFRSLEIPHIIRIDHPHAAGDSCDLLVVPNMHQEVSVEEQMREQFGARLLYGPEYVMLSEEVLSEDVRPYVDREYGPIVFCAGGSDPNGCLQKMHDWTEDFFLDNAMLMFARGTYAPIVRSRHPRKTPTIQCVFSPSLMQKASLVVGMFGVTPYEALRLQTPMLVMGHTEENVIGADVLAQRTNGAVESLHHIDDMSPSLFQETLWRYWACLSQRKSMHRRASKLIDGQGVTRITDAIMCMG